MTDVVPAAGRRRTVQHAAQAGLLTMPPSRIDLLRGFIEQRPTDPFPRYALALEHKNAGELDAAWETFRMLMGAHPDYVPAYLHAGHTLLALGRTAEARSTFESGIAASARKGDSHARGELESALAAVAEGGT
jgi:predicted Zn-dependent protease